MQWRHEVSLEWLKARQKYLTASEVRELLPVTRTGKPRSVTDADRMKVYARKLATLTEADTVSTGAAARGHVLEPWAVAYYNAARSEGEPMLFHWDDVVVHGGTELGLAFSPDAVSIPQPDEGVDIPWLDPWEHDDDVTYVIGEVKSYGAERHMACAVTPKNQLEERWQVAVAMCVDKAIAEAKLVFYNPGIPSAQLFCVSYGRRDLEDECTVVQKVARDWQEFIGSVGGRFLYELKTGLASEQTVVERIKAIEALDPDGRKSVC